MTIWWLELHRNNYLPDEFVLKKYIVALVIAVNILLCKFIDALIQIETHVIDLMKVAIMSNKVSTAKTVKQVCRLIDHHINVVDELFSVDVVSFSMSRKTYSSRFTLQIVQHLVLKKIMKNS